MLGFQDLIVAFFKIWAKIWLMVKATNGKDRNRCALYILYGRSNRIEQLGNGTSVRKGKISIDLLLLNALILFSVYYFTIMPSTNRVRCRS